MEVPPSLAVIVESGLCHGCGACAAVCPGGAVQIRETPAGFLAPSVDASACTDCGLCVEVCPGWHLAPALLDAEVDPFKGKVLAAYIAVAKDEQLLREAQSGGAVTALLSHLLQSGKIDGAVVTRMPQDGSLRPRPVLARTPDDLWTARGSAYCPVAVSGMLGPQVGPRTAFVGLSCHVHGLHNAVACQPERMVQPALTVGLICTGVMSFLAIDYLVGLAGLDPRDVQGFRYKHKARSGWPGDVRIVPKDGAERWVRGKQRTRCTRVFGALRCRLCFDRMNVLCDVTAGDPWGVRYDKRGCSVVLARTRRGRDALLSAGEAGAIRLEPLDAEAVFGGQTVDSRHRREWSALTEAWRQMGNRAPAFGIHERWTTPLQGVNLAPYFRWLRWSRQLAAAPTREQAMRVARRKLRRDRLWRCLSPRRYWDYLKSKCGAR